jgi:hypothetical protein
MKGLWRKVTWRLKTARLTNAVSGKSVRKHGKAIVGVTTAMATVSVTKTMHRHGVTAVAAAAVVTTVMTTVMTVAAAVVAAGVNAPVAVTTAMITMIAMTVVGAVRRVVMSGTTMTVTTVVAVVVTVITMKSAKHRQALAWISGHRLKANVDGVVDGMMTAGHVTVSAVVNK